uniref:Transmembrane protein n=1 Tax=Tanacetum cinerariifolium TaxID=118510 RepID=A0A6L2JXS5_TANCI|nr:hypothetical protein [Tanacetum cinerariifolium]
MHKAFPLPVIKFPLSEEVPTASEGSSHCQKKRDPTAVKIRTTTKVKQSRLISKASSFYNMSTFAVLIGGMLISAGITAFVPYVTYHTDLRRTALAFSFFAGSVSSVRTCLLKWVKLVDAILLGASAFLFSLLGTCLIENLLKLLEGTFTFSRPAIRASYSASLLVTSNLNLRALPATSGFDNICLIGSFMMTMIMARITKQTCICFASFFVNRPTLTAFHAAVSLSFRSPLEITLLYDFFKFLKNGKSLLNHDSSIISSSSKIDSLFDEFADELTLLKSILPGIDETDCYPEEETHFTKRLLYDNSSPRPPKEFVSENSNADVESFSPSPIPDEDSESFMEKIDLSFTSDDPMPPGIEEDDYDSERDIIILEELLDNYSLSLLVNESFHFDIPSFFLPPVNPPDGNTKILNIKMIGDNSEQKVPIPGLTITRVPNQEKSPDLLSHRGFEFF